MLTAGTSDIPVAEEAAALCHEMGCAVHSAYDVGVAGLHRLFEPLRAMLAAPADAIIVAAGMDGALPSVVAGLVDVPVIGLPTSVGYGLGGGGMGALTSMLQTCAPGLAVVNIDNGIGAGAMAGLIAARAGMARKERTSGYARTKHVSYLRFSVSLRLRRKNSGFDREAGEDRDAHLTKSTPACRMACASLARCWWRSRAASIARCC